MTDELIILNGCGNYSGEGFFKFEDGYTNMTVAFKDMSQKPSMWYADGNFGLFEKKTIIRTNSPLHSPPKNCGIFVLYDDNAHLILFYGDKNSVLSDFTALTGKNATEKYESEIQSELQSLPEPEIQTKTESLSEPTVNEVFALQKEGTKIPETFWDVNENDFNRLFENSPEDTYMNALIPGSRWVRRDEENYVLGIIYDEYSNPMYLCYGFKLPWSEEPPAKLEGYSQWIPKDCSRPHDDGYWVVYINAKTGERVK